jgi:hypothetical protein
MGRTPFDIRTKEVLANPDGPEAADLIERLVLRIATIEGALERYGQHQPACRISQLKSLTGWAKEATPCTCGWSEAQDRAALKSDRMDGEGK